MQNTCDNKPFAIVCIKDYEFEGTVFKVGQIGYNSFGRNIPDKWRKATRKNIDDYLQSTTTDKI